jgi:hypothetical protein
MSRKQRLLIADALADYDVGISTRDEVRAWGHKFREARIETIPSPNSFPTITGHVDTPSSHWKKLKKTVLKKEEQDA